MYKRLCSCLACLLILALLCADFVGCASDDTANPAHFEYEDVYVGGLLLPGLHFEKGEELQIKYLVREGERDTFVDFEAMIIEGSAYLEFSLSRCSFKEYFPSGTVAFMCLYFGSPDVTVNGTQYTFNLE